MEPYVDRGLLDTGSPVYVPVVQPVQEVPGSGDVWYAGWGTDLMAPGHVYNSRTRTGIEWLPAGSIARVPGRVRLWSRGWNGQPVLLAEAEHHTRSQWQYWYGLEFARSFPRVTHWWFGDAWTGMVRIWAPDGAGRDPESGVPMLSGWMRFGPASLPTASSTLTSGATMGSWAPAGTARGDVEGAPALPWTVLLSAPVRVNTPMPPMSANPVNLPLQLLLAERVIEMLSDMADRRAYRVRGITDDLAADSEGSLPAIDVAVTSLVRREDLRRAFPAEFGPWRLDRLPGLTPREALCHLQGFEPPRN